MTPLYETTRLLDEYLLFHYGSDEELLGHACLPREALLFPVRTVSEMLPERYGTQRALDLGCAVGRSSFLLSERFAEVVGIDFSHSFIAAANRLRDGETVKYHRHEEGHQYSTLEASMPPSSRPEVVTFQQGDAMDLPQELGKFDLLHAANLICRLTHPERLLQRLPELVTSGGTLILTTPCTWLEDFTPSEFWPEGSTLEWLKESLQPHFELEMTRDLPFIIREHARKYQLTVAQGSRWKRTDSAS